MAFLISPTPLAPPRRHAFCTRRPRACASPPTPPPPQTSQNPAFIDSSKPTPPLKPFDEITSDNSVSSASLDALLHKLRNDPPNAALARTVYLVGVGPGDPGMLTLAALRHMQRADVVLYDRLISPQILSLINPYATMVYVGKAAGFHTRTQEDIHLLLAFFACSGRHVVRLKGGDPLVFGRAGEEIDYLAQRGVHAHPVPGITAAAGIAADLAFPLTMRGVAHSVRFITGHAREGRQADIGHVDNDTTYVIYMGLSQMGVIVDAFINRGVGRDTPAVAVERGTTETQRAVAAPLCELTRKVEEANLCSPTLIFVGEVVRFARVWGVDGVVEGNSQNAAYRADAVGVAQETLDRAYDLIERTEG